MNLRPAYRLILGFALSAFLATSIVTQGVHVLLEHHEVQVSCDIGSDGAHLHSEEYAHHPCHLCLYKVSQYREAVPEVALVPPSFEAELKPAKEQPHLSLTSLMVRQQRAPPVRS